MMPRIHWNYLWWRLRHPARPFSDYYTAQVDRLIESGGAHGTLGPKIKNAEAFTETARLQLEFLRQQGLSPASRIVDYGCGSLRLGQQLIAELAPGHYLGLDASDRFFGPALAGLDPVLRRDKAPRCQVVSPEFLAQLAARETFDFVMATHVLIHVPWGEMRPFLERIVSLMSRGTVAFVDFHESPRRTQFHELTWGYPERDLHELIRGMGLSVETIAPGQNDCCRQLAEFYGPCYRILKIRRCPSD